MEKKNREKIPHCKCLFFHANTLCNRGTNKIKRTSCHPLLTVMHYPGKQSRKQGIKMHKDDAQKISIRHHHKTPDPTSTSALCGHKLSLIMGSHGIWPSGSPFLADVPGFSTIHINNNETWLRLHLVLRCLEIRNETLWRFWRAAQVQFGHAQSCRGVVSRGCK